jgi:hypothetical protein
MADGWIFNDTHMKAQRYYCLYATIRPHHMFKQNVARNRQAAMMPRPRRTVTCRSAGGHGWRV